MHAFANYITWLESQVEKLSDSTVNETSQSKIANFSFKVVKESKTDFSMITISLIGPNGKFAEYHESLQVKIDGARDGNPDVKWSFSHSGELKFKTFLSDVFGVAESRGPEYALEIFENPQNHLYHALMKIHFP